MADTNGKIEALEHLLLRRWLGNDRKALRPLLARRFRLVIGASKPVLLDRKSMLDAAGDRWLLSAFRFGAIYAREADGVGIFAAEVELDFSIDGKRETGTWWMTDIWRKSTMPRRWQLLERQLSRPESGIDVPAAVKALQLWR